MVFGTACVTLIPSFLAGVQGTMLMPLKVPTLIGWRMQHHWPLVNATVVSSSLTSSSVPGVAQEHLTYRYESHGRAFERKQMRWVAAARDSVQSFIFPTSILPPPNSTISVYYDPKAPALSIYQPGLLQYNVLRAVFARTPIHPLQGNRLPDPPPCRYEDSVKRTLL